MLVRIGTLSEMTGVSVDVLRSWERRYGLLAPERTAGGFRLYTDADVERIRAMNSLIAAGSSASEAARQVIEGQAPVPEEHVTALESVRDGLHGALRQLDEAALEAAIDRVLAAFDLDTAIRDVFLPALTGIGDDWASGAVTVAQEHFAVSVLRGRLLALARGWDGGLGPRVLLACPPGELHDVSLVMFGLALRRRGWRITFLGANTPVEDVFATLDRINARLAVLFAANWELHRELGHTLAANGASAIVLGGSTAGPLAGECGCRWLEGDPVSAADELTKSVAAWTALG